MRGFVRPSARNQFFYQGISDNTSQSCQRTIKLINSTYTTTTPSSSPSSITKLDASLFLPELVPKLVHCILTSDTVILPKFISEADIIELSADVDELDSGRISIGNDLRPDGPLVGSAVEDNIRSYLNSQMSRFDVRLSLCTYRGRDYRREEENDKV